jgi:hypothetical protein
MPIRLVTKKGGYMSTKDEVIMILQGLGAKLAKDGQEIDAMILVDCIKRLQGLID